MRIRVGLLLLTIVALIFWNLRYGPYRLKRLIDSGCAQAVQMAQRDFQVELDLSEESIAQVEAMAARAAAGPLTEARREELSKLLGVYLGEVARRYHGGEWLIPRDGPAAGALILRNRRGQSSPPARVYQKLSGGDRGSLADYYRTITTSQPAARPPDGSPDRPSPR